MNKALAALDAKLAKTTCEIPGLVVPEGWKLVPVEPTPEMCRALFRNLVHADNEVYVIKAVLAAAPTFPIMPI